MKPGKYRAKAAAIEFATTQNGNDYVQVAFEIDGQLEPWKGYLNNDENIQRTIRALRLMGWKGDDLEKIGIGDLPGWVQVEAREERDKDKRLKTDDNGNPIVRLAFVNSLSGLRDQPMAQDRKKALALRLRKAVAESPVCEAVIEDMPPEAHKAARDDTKAADPKTGDTDDDLPF